MQKDQQKKDDEIVYDENENIDTDNDSFEKDEGKDKILKLKEELKSCKLEKQEYLDGWQRAKADFINLKKRNTEELSGLKNIFLIDFINNLLPVLDSFEMAFKNKESWESAPENWRRGIEYIYNQIKNILDTYQVEKIDPEIGSDFNHTEHNSIGTKEVDDSKMEGKIVEVVLRGYKIKENLIRPSSVKIGITNNI